MNAKKTEKKQKRPIVVTFNQLSGRQKKKVAKKMTLVVAKNKKYRRALKKSETPIPKKAARAAAGVAVETALGIRTLKGGKVAIPPKKTALEKYTDLVNLFAKERKKYKKRQKKHLKAARNKGYDPKRGYYKLAKADKVEPAKMVKYR